MHPITNVKLFFLYKIKCFALQRMRNDLRMPVNEKCDDASAVVAV